MALSKLDGKGIDLSSNVLTNFASTGIDDNATSTVLTVDQNNGLIVNSSGTTTIQANGATHSIVRVMSGDDTSYGTVVFGDTSSNTSGQILYTHSNDAMVLKTDNTTAVTIDASQNVTLSGSYLKLSNGGKLQVSSSVPQNADLTGGSTNGTDSDGVFGFYGGLSYNTGAGIVLNGADHATNANQIRFMNGAWVERFRINENGTQKATFDDILLKESTSYVHYDVNVATTDAQWTGADYTKSAIFIDMDASGSGGDTADELRLYGIRTDLRSTHQTADLLTGVYGYVESQHSTGITSNIYGVYGYAVADDTGTGRTTTCIGVQGLSYGYGTGTGGVTTYYGGYFRTLLTTSADKDTTSAYGTRHEVEIDDPGQAQTLTNAYVVASEFDNDSAGNVTITNSYLYYGNYAGTLPTNAYGLYILDGVQNYLAGSFDVGGTKNFRIKHPLPALTETHDLVHTVIESPSADNIYSGMINLVNGSATVNIDTIAGMTEGTFVALNRSIRRFVSNEEGFTAVKSSIEGNILTITAQDNACTDEVFWMVIGQRQDAEIKAAPSTDANGYLIVEPEHVEHVRPEKGEIYDERDIGPDTVEE